MRDRRAKGKPRACPCLRLAGVVCAAMLLWPAMATPQGADRARADRLMAVLVAAYPEFLSRYDGNDIVWKDGTRMAFDDGRGVKDFETRCWPRPIWRTCSTRPIRWDAAGAPPAVNIDPGRVRYQPMFAKMYGDCTKGEVARHLVDVVWLPSKGWPEAQSHPHQRRGRSGCRRCPTSSTSCRRR